MNRLRERGFTVVEGLLVILLIAAVVAASWFVASRLQKEDEKSLNATQQSTDTTKTPAINETEDLDTASQALDYTNLDTDAADSRELDGELSAF
jgi:type II secretory pathway pseudopilin PulG